MLEALLAADIYLTLGGWSYHVDREHIKCSKSESSKKTICNESGFNEVHNSIIIDYNGFTAGIFKNSYNQRTKLAGYTYRLKNNLSFGAYYGTGYRDFEFDNTKCPIHFFSECLLLTASYSIKAIKLSLMGDALIASFEFKL